MECCTIVTILDILFVIETARTFRQQKRTTEKDRTRLEEKGTDPCQRGQESILPQKGYVSCYSLTSMCQSQYLKHNAFIKRVGSDNLEE